MQHFVEMERAAQWGDRFEGDASLGTLPRIARDAPPRAVRVIELDASGVPAYSGLHLLEVGTRLVFNVRPNARIDLGSLAIWTNCPVSPGQEFRRHTYSCVEGSDEGTVNGDWQAYVDLWLPGAFEFFAEFDRFDDGTGVGGSTVSTPSATVTRAPHATQAADAGIVRVSAPDQSRRGPVSRFVVQPELVIRLLRPVSSRASQAVEPPTSAAPQAGSSPDDDEDVVEATQDAVEEALMPSAAQPLDLGTVPSVEAAGSLGGCATGQCVPLRLDDGDGRSGTPRALGVEHAPALVASLLPALAPPRSEHSGDKDDGATDATTAYEAIALPLPLEGICLQTQLTRCLGPIDGWLRFTRTASDGAGGRCATASELVLTGTLAEPLALKFNMIHLTPVQTLGCSRSAYSIGDQLTLEPTMFAGNRVVNGALAAARSACAAGWLDELLAETAPQHPSSTRRSSLTALSLLPSVRRSRASTANSSALQSQSSTPRAPDVSDTTLRLAAPAPSDVTDDALAPEKLATDSRSQERRPASSVAHPTASATSSRASVGLVGPARRAAAEVRIWSHPFVEGAKSAVLGAAVAALEASHGALMMVDVVLNHTSADSAWLRIHPEAAYSLDNCPHLRAAFELDESVLRVSNAIAAGDVVGVSPALCNEAAVHAAVGVLRNDAHIGLPAARLWEFYCADVIGTLAVAIAMHLPSVVTLDLDALTVADNVEGGDTVRISPPAALVTVGVPPPRLTDARRIELAAARCPDVQAVLRVYKERGYGAGHGEGLVTVSDAAIESLATALAASPPPLPLDKAIERLRMPYAAVAGIDSHIDGVSDDGDDEGSAECGSDSNNFEAHTRDGGSAAQSRHSRSTAIPGVIASVPIKSAYGTQDTAQPRGERRSGFDTPPSLPHAASASAFYHVGSDMPVQEAVALPFGRPDAAPLHEGVPPTFIKAPHDAPLRSRRGSQGAAGSPSTVKLGRGATVARADGLTGRTKRDAVLAQRLRMRSGRWLRDDRIVTPVGVADESPVSIELRAQSPSAKNEGSYGTVQGDFGKVLAGSAFNDGSGGRFSVHIDTEAILVGLNEILERDGNGWVIDPIAWTWPVDDVQTPLNAGMLSSGLSHRRTMPLLPSLQLVQRVIDAVNLVQYKRYDDDISAAMSAITGTAIYTWLNVWKCSERLSPTRPIVYSYFTRITTAAATERAAFGGNAASDTAVLACNGFIWNGDPEGEIRAFVSWLLFCCIQHCLCSVYLQRPSNGNLAPCFSSYCS